MIGHFFALCYCVKHKSIELRVKNDEPVLQLSPVNPELPQSHEYVLDPGDVQTPPLRQG